MSFRDRYATFANFGGGHKDQSTRPQIKTVTIAECIKRRLPSKHYVYKMVVEWTSGTTSIVYRRYSMFFDFQVKLQELYTSVCQRTPQFIEKVPHLPELPGKILFGRSQIHQVAEKRRGKIEEFCQQVVSLPAEISHTNLVMGFFNTWPEDTMLPLHSESVSSSYSSSFTSSTISSTQLTSPTSPLLLTPNTGPFTPSATAATEAVISHPDEMENLEQYSVLADYHRKDSHQVNLTEGQVVHVIEKHDTGWWMVMSEDEQGYAPAAYLEPMEAVGKHVEQLMESGGSCEEYEAMESYSAQNEDEVDFRVGDRVDVINKSLDGWWKIRCNNKVGLAPSALIRKRIEAPQLPRDDVIYESHKSIYEGLNIHRPPPRRNTIERNHSNQEFGQGVYAVPRANPPLVKMIDDFIPGMEEEHDYVEPPLELTSEDEEDPGYYRIPRSLQSRMSDTSSTRLNDSVYSPPPKSSDDSSQRPTTSSPTSTQRDSTSSEPSVYPTSTNFSEAPQGNSSNTSYQTAPRESHYDIDPSLTDRRSSSSSHIYQNTDNARAEAEAYKSCNGESSSVRSPITSTTSPPPSSADSTSKNKEDRDYVDIDQHDEYVDPEELMVGETGSTTGDSVPPTSPSSTASSSIFKPLPKPPLPTSDPPKRRPPMNKSKSLSIELSGIVEDEYIPMDPIYTEPPLEEPETHTPTNTTPLPKLQKQQKSPTPSTPSSVSSSSIFSPIQSPSATQAKKKKQYPKLKVSRDKVQISSPVLVEKNSGLTKAKSLEDLLGSPSSRESSPQRHGSPQTERKSSPGRGVQVLPLAPIAGKGRGAGDQPNESRGLGGRKPKLGGKNKTGKGKQSFETQAPHHVLQSSTPPSGASPEHPSITHTTSVPIPSASQQTQSANKSVHLKTYVALSDYQSDIAGCLSFQAGDKCVLLRKTLDGWWLVNIGGREGWTPEGFWKEEAWNQASTIARPPGPAPSVSTVKQPEKKPRSHTVATDTGSNCALELSSSMEASLEATSSQSSRSGSVEVDRLPSGESVAPWEGKKPIPPPPPSQSSKPGRREQPPPPKPKPFLPNNPARQKGENRKPPVAQKPSKTISHSSPSTSPPLPRRRSEDIFSPSPPPPPPHPSGQKRLEMAENSEYVMLEHTHTLDPLESSPWFVGKMERVNAEQFLMEHGRQREFLVRERTAKDGYYALSIRYHYSCKHFNIDPNAQGQYVIGNLTFPAIADIVHHYQNNSLFIHENQHVTLAAPARKRTRTVTAHS